MKCWILKLLLIPLLLLIACLIAGLYGAMHNQISYTVSPDYFHQFKFIQFGLIHFQDRTGAAFVGWYASWWMGIIIGIVLVPVSLIVPGAKGYFVAALRAFGVVTLTALATGLTGLLLGFLLIDPQRVGPVERYGQLINDPAAFWRAGTMHSFSYLGGLLGIVTGLIYLGVVAWRRRTRLASAATAGFTSPQRGAGS